MVTFYVFLFVVGAVGGVSYVLLFFSHVPGAKDERLGILEPLPENLGEWVSEGKQADGAVKERRQILADSSGVDTTKLIIQVRYRDPRTSDIIRIDPEQTYRRRRKRQ